MVNEGHGFRHVRIELSTVLVGINTLIGQVALRHWLD